MPTIVLSAEEAVRAKAALAYSLLNVFQGHLSMDKGELHEVERLYRRLCAFVPAKEASTP